MSRPRGYRYWRSITSSPASVSAITATAPGCSTNSRSAVPPFGSRTVSLRTLPSYTSLLESRCSLRSFTFRRLRSQTLDRVETQLHERLRQDAQREHRQPVRRQEDAHVELRIDPPRVLGLVEIHELDDANIVKRPHQREQHGDQREPHLPGAEHRLKHRKLRVEPHGGRNSREREHQEQHDEREPRAARIQPPEVLDSLGLEA